MSMHEHDLTKGRPMHEAESGQTMAEYAVVLVVLVPGLILLFTGLGGAVGSAITSVARLLP
jgi:Flp pilus assembly pilin Flp